MNAVVSTARGLVGTRFRPQGRDGSDGLDCLGLALASHGIAATDVPRDYRLRGDHANRLIAEAARWFDLIDGDPEDGDVLLMRAGPRQCHLAIMCGDGMIHADAGLGKVTESSKRPNWPIDAILRFRKES